MEKKWLVQPVDQEKLRKLQENLKINPILLELLIQRGIYTYEEAKGKTKQEFMNYIITNRLKNLLEVIDEF